MLSKIKNDSQGPGKEISRSLGGEDGIWNWPGNRWERPHLRTRVQCLRTRQGQASEQRHQVGKIRGQPHRMTLVTEMSQCFSTEIWAEIRTSPEVELTLKQVTAHGGSLTPHTESARVLGTGQSDLRNTDIRGRELRGGS